MEDEAVLEDAAFELVALSVKPKRCSAFDKRSLRFVNLISFCVWKYVITINPANPNIMPPDP